METITQSQTIESVETATSAPSDPQAPPSVIRCIARTRDGRRCRLRAKDPDTHLCSRHATRDAIDRLDDSIDLSSEILGPKEGDYANIDTISSILSNVVELVVAGRLSPRRAAVITYSLSLMLRSYVIAQRDAPFPQLPDWCYRDTPPPGEETSPSTSTSNSNSDAPSGSGASQPNSTASPKSTTSQPMSPYDAIQAYNRLRS